MGDTPFFSLIIPVYNTAKYLCQCLDSFVSQTYRDFEIICVDDGSDDESPEILKKYSTDHQYIHVINSEHSDAGTARNIGIAHARGKYLGFPDSDDFVTEDFLELCHRQIIEVGCDLLAYDFYHYDDVTREYTEPDWYVNKRYLPKEACFSPSEYATYLFQIFGLVVNNKFISRDIFERADIRFSGLSDANDEYAGSMALVHAERISCVDKRIYFYRRNSGTSIQDRIHKRYSDNLLIAQNQISDSLRKEGLIDTYLITLQNKILSECDAKLHDIYDWDGAEKFFKRCGDVLLGEGGSLCGNCEYIFEMGDIFFYEGIKDGDCGRYFFEEYLRRVDELLLKDWRLPKEKLQGKRVLIYGAGAVGRSFYEQISNMRDIRLAGWVDRDYIRMSSMGIPVEAPESIQDKDYDCILIAISDQKVTNDIRNRLLEWTEDDKILDIHGRR